MSASISLQSIVDILTMSNVRFLTDHNSSGRGNDFSDSIKQNLEDYRRKIRFKQVKFSIVVLAWQSALIVLR